MNKFLRPIVLWLVVIYLFHGAESRNKNGVILELCHEECLPYQFNCHCEKGDSRFGFFPKMCIPRSWQCDGWQDCPDGSDEIECRCEEGLFQCGCERGGACLLNTIYECINPTLHQCASMKDSDSRCTEPEKRCDGFIDCPWQDFHDETNCTSCVSGLPNRCECNKPGSMTCTGKGFVCFPNGGKCDKITHCIDGSDEIDCPCSENEYKCQCYAKKTPSCSSSSGCIPLAHLYDGVQHCPDGSDETPFLNRIKSQSNDVTIWRFNDLSQCNRTDDCNSCTCYDTLPLLCSGPYCDWNNTICTSSVEDNSSRGFQCADGSLLISSQFCNYHVDCPDDSDEIRNEPGFKCLGDIGSCVLPQRNLFDNVSHCQDGSDLCFDGQHKCHTCLDKQLIISPRQVCDGVIDCYDFSDECLCNNTDADNSRCLNIIHNYQLSSLPIATRDGNETQFIDFEVPQNHSNLYGFNILTKTCQTKWGIRTAVMCDGRPECRDFSDECNCTTIPSFCNDPCHSFYPLGDRYCDGIEDEAWIYINSSICPKGFDELLCPKRFSCKAGNRVSIDANEICDGFVNCDNGVDESICHRNATGQAVLRGKLLKSTIDAKNFNINRKTPEIRIFPLNSSMEVSDKITCISATVETTNITTFSIKLGRLKVTTSSPNCSARFFSSNILHIQILVVLLIHCFYF